MIKASPYFLPTCLVICALSGCSFDTAYEAEKAYWKARKLDRKLPKLRLRLGYLQSLADKTNEDKEESEVTKALEEALTVYTSHWDRGESGNTDKIAGRYILLCLIQKKEWEAAAAHLNSLMRRFPDDPGLIQLSKSIYWQRSGNPAEAMQIIFDSSSDSPLVSIQRHKSFTEH